MSSTITASGNCLCGAVTVEAASMSTDIASCHCNICRKWGGGPLMAVDCATEVTIKGQDSIKVFATSDWAERGFCAKCGTHLFFRLKESGQYIIPVGLFDQQAPLHFGLQIFVDEKPDYYAFGNPTSNLTGAEFFAQLTDQD
ncbi:GFA family protein [Pontibacter sp. JAM-7]|uniref:GFA family protein n=1 Tax=Pontibacter sp. JAM-7 TaxID=3366581 RepID=UPI003AF7E6ED